MKCRWGISGDLTVEQAPEGGGFSKFWLCSFIVVDKLGEFSGALVGVLTSHLTPQMGHFAFFTSYMYQC